MDYSPAYVSSKKHETLHIPKSDEKNIALCDQPRVIASGDRVPRLGR